MSPNNSGEKTVPEAWVALPSEAEIRVRMKPGSKYPYDLSGADAQSPPPHSAPP